MKILFLCPHFPYPPDHGARIRAYHFIRHLSRMHTVTLVTLAHTKKELSRGVGLANYCDDIIVEVLPTHVRWWQAFGAFGSRTPSSVAYFRSTMLKRRIEEKLRTQKFDAVIVFCAFMAQYALDVDARLRFLDYGDLDSGKWAEYARYKPFPLSYGYGIEARKLRRYERSIAERFDRCSVISKGELEEFNRFNSTTPCTIIPNGVDVNYFRANAENTQRSPVIVFLGRMNYFPNIDGVIYFAQEIFPKIRKKKAEAELRIIGSNPPRSVRRLAKIPNISVTGEVSDVRPYLTDATVSVVPLRIARGTQNKILESMAMGIPVVTTPEAAKGVQCVPSEHLLVADGPADFAEKVVDLIENGSLQKKLSQAARCQILQSHSWERSMKALTKMLNLGRSAPQQGSA